MKNLILSCCILIGACMHESVFAQNTKENDPNQSSKASTVGYKGATFGDPARNEESGAYKGAAFGDPARRGGANTNLSITFVDDYNIKKFEQAEDILIKWQLAAEIEITKAIIIDLTSDDMDTVWSATSIPENQIDYAKIKTSLVKPLEQGHTYKLSIELNNNTSSSFDFQYGK